MTRVTSRSEPLFQSVRVRLRFASTYIIRFALCDLKNSVRLRFDKNSVKSVYKTPVRVRFDSLIAATGTVLSHIIMYFHVSTFAQLGCSNSYMNVTSQCLFYCRYKNRHYNLSAIMPRSNENVKARNNEIM